MKQCSTHPVLKYIRIILSLVVVGLGIAHKNWLGIIGVITLISAFTGSCPLTINLKRDSHIR